MTTQSLIVGLDGADMDVILHIGADTLPTLHRLIASGAHARLTCVTPPATLPNWTTFLTGVDPGVHGVFDFTVRTGYRVKFTGGSVREVPTVFSRLDALGLRCACISFPGTWPTEQLQQGVYISGWDAPVAFEANASYVWPRQLHTQLLQQFGPLRFDTVDEFQADQPGWHEQLPAMLKARIQQKTNVATWLLKQARWDVFAVYFGESDTASHHLWSLYDPHSPRRPVECSQAQSQGLIEVYRALDHALAELIDEAGGMDHVEVTVISDHGSGGSSDKVLYLNRWLAEMGLLHFKSRARFGTLANHGKQLALRALSPKLRQGIFDTANRWLPSMLESQARFGNIDMTRTRIFSDELNYFPALCFNLVGREPNGQVHPKDKAALYHDLQSALLAMRDPWSGSPVIKAVHRREDLFEGPHLERAPDLLLEFHLDQGYSYNLLPSSHLSDTRDPWRRLESGEYLGRKGRSLAGSHRDHGIFLASGPRLTAQGEFHIHMTEAMGHVLSRLDKKVIFDGIKMPIKSVSEHELRQKISKQGQAQIAARLRNLGYID